MLRNFAALLVMATLLGACGKDNNFQATDTPDFQVDGDGFIRIVMPRNETRTDSFPPELVLRNTGDAPLKVSKLSWIDKPSRLVALGARTDVTCSDTSECGSNEVCLTASSTCVSTELEATPFEIPSQQRVDLTFAVTAGPPELPCPEPTIEVPDQFLADYCGALQIETNAINDFGEIVTDGKATIYFLDPGASGQIQADPTFLEFTNVQPGTTNSQTFSVTNAGTETLTINSIGVEDNQQYFTIEPFVPLDIPAGQAQVFTITLAVPADATDYEVFTTMNIDSSAGNESIAIEVTADAGSAPVIELSDEVLKFDAATSQTLTVSNTGQATLQINGLNVSPTASRAFYSFSIDGNDVTQNFQTVNIPKGESKDIVVNFTRPAGNTDPSIGLLEIAHNDRNIGFRSEVTLLGDAGDVPIARLSPESFTFLAADGNSDTRKFVVRNVGTAALDISSVAWMFSTGSNAEFQISPMSGSVAPGGLLEATVNFTGMNATPDVGLATLESNNSTPIELSLRALDSAAEQPVPTITVSNQGSIVAGAPVNLTAASSTPAGITTNAIWTLLSRPAGSSTWFDAVGETASFMPDMAGTYKVALTLGSSDREAQTTMDIVVN